MRLEKRGDSWRAVVFLGRDPATGKRKFAYSKPIKAKNKKEAEKEAKLFEAQILKGEYVEAKNFTMTDLFKHWLEVHGPNLRESTRENYEIIINAHLIPAFGYLDVQKVQSFHIEQYYLNKAKNGRRDGKGGLSARSIQYHRRILSEVLDYAVHPIQLITVNPARYIKTPTPKRKKIVVPTVSQIDQLLAMVNESSPDVYYAAIYLTVYTGLRSSEVRALRWMDIDFKDNTIQIEQTIYKNKLKKMTFPDTKNESSNRKLTIPKECIKILKDLRRQQIQEKLETGVQLEETDLVFIKPDGTPMSKDALRYHYDKAAKAVGASTGIHKLRHAHATLMLEAGVETKVASKRLGHSSVVITADIYQQVRLDVDEEALDKVQKKMQDARRASS